MRRVFQLSAIVVEAALIAFAGAVGVVLGIAGLGLNIDERYIGADLVGAGAALIPAVVAAVWLFRKLQSLYSRREARAMSMAFGISAPFSIAVSMVFGEITGGYAEALGAHGFFILVGAFGGPFALTVFLSLLVCALVQRITRMTMELEQNE